MNQDSFRISEETNCFTGGDDSDGKTDSREEKEVVDTKC